jgi:hypothetical protein
MRFARTLRGCLSLLREAIEAPVAIGPQLLAFEQQGGAPDVSAGPYQEAEAEATLRWQRRERSATPRRSCRR